jgi:formyltetrahydrofolate hydrolase
VPDLLIFAWGPDRDGLASDLSSYLFNKGGNIISSIAHAKMGHAMLFFKVQSDSNAIISDIRNDVDKQTWRSDFQALRCIEDEPTEQKPKLRLIKTSGQDKAGSMSLITQTIRRNKFSIMEHRGILDDSYWRQYFILFPSEPLSQKAQDENWDKLLEELGPLLEDRFGFMQPKFEFPLELWDIWFWEHLS